MGRFSTGVITTVEAQRIELSWLLKKGLLPNEGIYSGSLSWSNGNEINIYIEIREGKGFIRLWYCNTSYHSGEVNNLDYKIQLVSIPSNLGRGKIWYFICPITGKKVRILYKVYGSLYFKSRGAYSHRIYYSCQITSKKNYHSDRYFTLEKIYSCLAPKMKKAHYQGKETRLQKRIKKLESLIHYHESERWKSFITYFGNRGKSLLE